MKNLNQFIRFDFEQFSAGKVFQVNGVKPWKDYDNPEKILGTTIEVFVAEDKTHYITRDGSRFSNRGEKFSIKIPATSVDVDIDDIVVPVNPVATVYGDFRNQLSVKADDIEAIDM